MATIKSPEQQNNEARLFWQNVQRLRRECLNGQSRQPNRYSAAYKGNEEGAAEQRKSSVQPPH
jgi:hypothetical protein